MYWMVALGMLYLLESSPKEAVPWRMDVRRSFFCSSVRTYFLAGPLRLFSLLLMFMVILYVVKITCFSSVGKGGRAEQGEKGLRSTASGLARAQKGRGKNNHPQGVSVECAKTRLKRPRIAPNGLDVSLYPPIAQMAVFDALIHNQPSAGDSSKTSTHLSALGAPAKRAFWFSPRPLFQKIIFF